MPRLALLTMALSVGLVACSDDKPPTSSSEGGSRGHPPTIQVQEPSAPFNLGQPLTWEATVTDPDLGDVVTVEWAFSDASGATVGTGRGLSMSQTFDVPGTYGITAIATDKASLTATWTGQVSVRNGPPSLSVDSPRAPLGPGRSYTWTATVTDPNAEEGDSVVVSWSFSDGVGDAEGLSVSRTFADTGHFVVRAVATDEGGLSATWADTVVVNNEAPRLDVIAPPGPLKTDVEYTWAAVAVDPNAAEGDSISLIWSFSDGKAGATGPSVTRSFDTPGMYKVSVVAMDRGGLSATWVNNFTVDMLNTAPTIRVVPPTSPRRPGVPMTWTATVSDPDAGDSLVVTWDFSGGLGQSTGLTATRTIPSGGSYNVRATVRDLGGLENSWSERFTIVDLPPVAKITAPADTLFTYKNYTLTSAGSSDPDGGDVTYGWSLDGVALSGETGATLDVRQNTPGVYTYGLIVVDDEGDSTKAQIEIPFVGNTPPAITGPVKGEVAPEVGVSYNYSVVVSDPDGDLASVTFDWGDGSGATVSMTLPAEVKDTVTLGYTYSTAGNFTIRVTVTDSRGNDLAKTLDVEAAEVLAFMDAGLPITGLVAAWDPSDTTYGALAMIDGTGNGRHCSLGTNFIDPVFAPARDLAAGVLTFAGTDLTYVDCPGDVATGITGDWTVVTVAQADTGAQPFMSWMSTPVFEFTSQSFQIFQIDRTLTGIGARITTSGFQRVVSEVPVADSGWASFALTSSTTVPSPIVWANGEQGGTLNVPMTLNGGMPTSGHLVIGASCTPLLPGIIIGCGELRKFHGSMGPVLIYDRALSQAELKQVHNALRRYATVNDFAYKTLEAK